MVFMVFQGMFFIITPALICGAFAERMRFSAMAFFMMLWGTLVYCPLCHWVWGGGLLSPDNPGRVDGRSARFCRRHGRAHQFRRLGPDLCAARWSHDWVTVRTTCGRTT